MALDKAYTLTMGGKTWALDCPKENFTEGTRSATIKPNVYNSFGTISYELTITKGSEKPNVVNMYIIRLVAGADCAVTFNDWSLKWVGGNAPTLTEGKTYEITIIDNLAIYVEA